jgi:hypothetical protein
MQSCHCIALNPAGPPRGVRPFAGRLRALVVGVILASLILLGERWLLVEAPLAGMEEGLAIRLAEAIGGVRAAHPGSGD